MHKYAIMQFDETQGISPILYFQGGGSTRTMKPLTRRLMKQRLIDAARTDERIVGLVDYGSSSYERDDEWSDIDVAFFIRDDDFEAFYHAWKSWAAQFGDLLLAYLVSKL